MYANIFKTYGVIFSQRFVLKLIEKGMSREMAYDIVQPNAIKSWENKLDFKTLMEQDERVRNTLTQEEIDDCFDPKYQVRNVDTIFKRVGIL